MFRMLFPVLIACSATSIASQPDKPLLAFSAADQGQRFQAKLPNGLRVDVEKDELGWVVGVFKGKSQDSLLYPQHNWHGAWPCQLSAWSHKRKTYPDIRVIPIRGYGLSLVVDLSGVSSTGEIDHEVFTNGTIKISWHSGA